jgi:hypothetical protein
MHRDALAGRTVSGHVVSQDRGPALCSRTCSWHASSQPAVPVMFKAFAPPASPAGRRPYVDVTRIAFLRRFFDTFRTNYPKPCGGEADGSPFLPGGSHEAYSLQRQLDLPATIRECEPEREPKAFVGWARRGGSACCQPHVRASTLLWGLTISQALRPSSRPSRGAAIARRGQVASSP